MQIAQQIALLLAGLVIFIFAGRLARFREEMRRNLNSQSPIPLSGGPSTTLYTWMIIFVGLILIAASVYGLLKNFIR